MEEQKIIPLDAKDENRPVKKHAKKEEIVLELPRNVVIHFAGIEGEISREDIKSRVAEIDPDVKIAFINFERGCKMGEIRFSKEDDGSNFLAKLEDGKMKVKDVDLSIKLLEGEEHEEYIKMAIIDMKRIRLRKQQKRSSQKRWPKKKKGRKSDQNQEEGGGGESKEQQDAPVKTDE